MKFTTYSYADVSTAYLDPGDLDLLADAPGHLAQLDNEAGDFFWVPSKANATEPLAEWKERVTRHGMSQRFLDLMLELREQGVPYVRFDADGGEVAGYEPAEAFAGAV